MNTLQLLRPRITIVPPLVFKKRDDDRIMARLELVRMTLRVQKPYSTIATYTLQVVAFRLLDLFDELGVPQDVIDRADQYARNRSLFLSDGVVQESLGELKYDAPATEIIPSMLNVFSVILGILYKEVFYEMSGSVLVRQNFLLSFLQYTSYTKPIPNKDTIRVTIPSANILPITYVRRKPSLMDRITRSPTGFLEYWHLVPEPPKDGYFEVVRNHILRVWSRR